MICKYCRTNTMIWLDRTTVCTECGVETPTPYDVGEKGWSLSLDTYSRIKRFEKLFDSVVLCHGTEKDNKMLYHLATFGKCDMDTLLQRIKDSKLTDKRYGSLHLFAKVFREDYIAPEIPKDHLALKQKLLKIFKNFEFVHKRHFPTQHFFNYRWLIRKLLHQYGHMQFDEYIKPIQCAKRQLHYLEMFENYQSKIGGFSHI